jgi:hypothetical protein
LSFGLSSQRQPIDPVKREEFGRKFRNVAGPPTDRL